jgi:hypothetical protein
LIARGFLCASGRGCRRRGESKDERADAPARSDPVLPH